MINVNSISSALYTILSSDSALLNAGVSIDLNCPLNTDPNRSPWIGILYEGTKLEPYRANINAPFMAKTTLHAFIQSYCFNGEENVRAELDNVVNLALTAVSSNKNLGGTVLSIFNMSITPYQFDMENEDSMLIDDLQIEVQNFA